jgi:sugar phosphate isomerase/epimerase
MKTSFFGFFKDIDSIARAGYDCVELHVKELMSVDDAEAKGLRKKIRDAGVTSEVFDNPLPLDKVIADADFLIPEYTEYVKKAVGRMAYLGARYIVYGNGKTRSCSDSLSTAKNDEMLAIICALAAEANITVMLEPLAAQICNRFLSVKECYEYAWTTGIPNLKTLIDYRWFLAGNHDFRMIENYANFIVHAHIDNPVEAFPKRLVPSVDDGHDYSFFFNTLKKICYKGIISIEANTFTDFDSDLKKGLELFAHYGIEPYKA